VEINWIFGVAAWARPNWRRSLTCQNARLIRKTEPGGDRGPTLYIVAVSKADQAVEIIRSKAAADGDEVEDLGRVAGSLVQALNLAPGEFIHVDGNYKPQGH
jgi:hypothetical protein